MARRRHCWEDLLGPQERLVASSYERVTSMGQRPALLLIDLYEQVFGDGPELIETAIQRYPASCGEAAWEALPALERMLEVAREHAIPVVHCTGEDRVDGRLDGATRRRSEARSTDARAAQIVESLRPVEGEFVVRKTRASAFYGTPLRSWLTAQGVDSLVVGGETTSGCVRASVVDAFSEGWPTMVCEDAVFDRSPLSHRVSLFDLSLKYASVVHVDEALAYLRRPTTAVA